MGLAAGSRHPQGLGVAATPSFFLLEELSLEADKPVAALARSDTKLLTVCGYQSEAVEAMANRQIAQRREGPKSCQQNFHGQD